VTLSVQLLYAYEECLKGIGAPAAEWFRPGLTAEKIEEAVAPLGLRLPSEARIWWEWHDGATAEGRELLPGPLRQCLTLVGAVDLYRRSRVLADKAARTWPEHNSDFLWSPTWFPVVGWQLPIVIDCSVAEGQATPLRIVDWQDVEGFLEPQAQSLGQMVAWWIEAIDVGALEWNGADRKWLRHDIPEWAQRTNPLI
jgi:hypothetical protein